MIGLLAGAAKAEGTIKGDRTEGKRGTKLLRKASQRYNSVRILPSDRSNAVVRKHKERSSPSQKSSKKKSSGKKDGGERLYSPTIAPMKVVATPSPVRVGTDSPVKAARTPPPEAEKACTETVNRKGEKSAKPSECEKQDLGASPTIFPTNLPSPGLPPPTTLPTESATPQPTLAQTETLTVLPTITPTTSSPSLAPTSSAPTLAPTTSVPTLAPSMPTGRPSLGPILLIDTTTVVSISINPSAGPSFQDIIEVATLACDQIRTQSSAIVSQAAPLIVAGDVSCSILRDSTADAILLEIGIIFEDSSIIIPGDSEIAAIVCNVVTGQNAAALLGQITSLPATNGFSTASAVQCSLSADATKAPTTRPTAQPVTSVPTGSPTVLPSSSAPTKRPTTLPTRAPANSPSQGPTRLPLTVLPTTAPVKAPTVSPTSGTLAPTIGISTIPSTAILTSAPTVVPQTPGPTIGVTSNPTPIPTSSTTGSPTQLPTNLIVTTAPTDRPNTLNPTSSPVLPTEVPSIRPSQSKQPSPQPVTKAPTSAPSLKESSAPSFQPTLRPTRVPTKSPSRSPVTQSPTIGPTTSQPTVSPTSAPVSGTIVNASPFTGVYTINSLIVLEAQDFVEAAETTCQHIRQQISSTFTTGFVTVETVGCVLQQANDSPLSIDFDLFVAFGGTAATPTTADVDILVSTSFLQPALQSLIGDLQILDGFNPFSTTTGVLHTN